MAKKKSIKKILSIVGISILVLIVVLIGAIQFFGGSIVKAGVQIGGSKAMGVDVKLKDADMSLFAGTVTLDGLKVPNPEGFKHEYLMELDKAHVDVSIPSVFSDTVIIETLSLDGITMVIEQKEGSFKNNLKVILDNLPKSEEPEEEPVEEPEEETKAGSKQLEIALMEIKNITVKAKLLPIPGKADTVTIKIDPIIMENLGTTEKLDMATLTAKILKAIAVGIGKQAGGVLPDDMASSFTAGLDKSGKLLKDVGDKSLDIGKGIGDVFEGILGGDKKDK